MPALPVARLDAPIAAPALELVERGGLHAPMAPADRSAEAGAELRRWYVFLGVPFVLSAVFFIRYLAGWAASRLVPACVDLACC